MAATYETKTPDSEKEVFNDTDIDIQYKANGLSERELAQFDEFSDDEEAAFGTTIPDDNYMTQYKHHNRTNTANTNFGSTLLSPDTADVKNLHVKFAATTLDKERTITDNTTINAMAQAAKYYNDLNSGNVSPIMRGHKSTMSTSNAYEIMKVVDSFESRELGYGQSALFDKDNEQYFADISNKDKRHVLINLHVSRITEIDTVRERFRCQFWISFSWLPTYSEWLEYKDYKRRKNLVDWRPYWIPIITFPELINQWKLHFAERPRSGKFSITSLHGKEEEIGYDPSYCKFIRCKLECDMTLSTGFFLLNFPVDCQDLPISIHETSGGCIFVAEKRKRSFASVHTISSVMEEWEFLNMMIEIGQLITGGHESSLAQIKVRLKMQRRWQVYFWNVVFFMALISGLTLCSFAVDDTDLGERLAIIITLLLTSVAYQSNVFSTLPNVPYLTLLDKYIVSSFVFMTLVTVETALLGLRSLDIDEYNHWVFMITWMIFLGYHVIFLVVAIVRKKFEENKLHMPSKTMLQLYSQSRERMDVDWNSERQFGSTWKVYTKFPDKLITKIANNTDMYKRSQSKLSVKSRTGIF